MRLRARRSPSSPAAAESSDDAPVPTLDRGAMEDAIDTAMRELTSDGEDASALLDNLRDRGVLPNEVSHCLALRVLREKKLIEPAKQVIAGLGSSGYELGSMFCAEVLKVYAADGDWRGIMEKFDTMQQQGVVLDVEICNTMLLAILRGRGSFKGATTVSNLMRRQGVKPNLETNARLAEIACAEGEIEFAMNRMRSIDQKDLSGSDASASLYRAVLRASAKAGKASFAREILPIMHKQGIVPRQEEISDWIRAVYQAPAEDGGLTIKQIFRRLEREKGVVLTDSHYDLAISMCERQEDWQETVAFATRMGQRKVRPLEMTCYSVLHACANLELWQPALSLISTLEAEGIDPEVVGYTYALQACAAAAQWAEIVKIHDKLHAHGRTLLEPDAVCPILAALSETGREKEAYALYNESSDAGLLKLWRHRRLAMGPRVLDARDMLPQVAGIAVWSALQEASSLVDGTELDKGQAFRRSLLGIASTRPEDLVVVYGETEEDAEGEASGSDVVASVLAVVRDVLGEDVELEQVSIGSLQCVRITGAQLEALKVRKVQKAVSEFTPGSKHAASDEALGEPTDGPAPMSI